jgi:hypothetical protein
MGGNLIDYPGDVSTKTADLTTEKIVFTSVLSTPKAKFMGIDLRNFISTCPWIAMGICAYLSISSPMKSSSSATYGHLYTTAMFI